MNTSAPPLRPDAPSSSSPASIPAPTTFVPVPVQVPVVENPVAIKKSSPSPPASVVSTPAPVVPITTSPGSTTSVPSAPVPVPVPVSVSAPAAPAWLQMGQLARVAEAADVPMKQEPPSPVHETMNVPMLQAPLATTVRHVSDEETDPSSVAGSMVDENEMSSGKEEADEEEEEEEDEDDGVEESESESSESDPESWSPADWASTKRTPLNCMSQDKMYAERLKRPPPSSASDLFNEMTLGLPCKRVDRKSSLHGPSHLFLRKLEQDGNGTLVVFQPTCLDHHNDTHQESRERLSVLCGPDGVLHKNRFTLLKWADLDELRPVRLADMLRVHSYEYIHHLETVCAALPPQDAQISVGALYRETLADGTERQGVPESTVHEWIQTEHAKKCFKADNPPSSGHLDFDSPISRRSYAAARLAAGSVCHAIDSVMQRKTRNAFVVVRPPGHHAGPNGCVDSGSFHGRPEMCTCGFCLINNIAIGAAYAMTTYGKPYYSEDYSNGPGIQRVAIVDIDIHHGNGTEEIIRNLVPHTQNYPLPQSWAPLPFSSYKPWRDDHDIDNVFFASIHLYDGDNFYPCSGEGPHGESAELQKRPNILNLPLQFLGPKYLEEREKLSVKAKKALMEQASREFRERITTKVIPGLRAFHPDLIMMSCGFDGHADDFYYFLTEDDYGWATEQLTMVARECCDGRLVSVLEGGYNVEPAANQKPNKKRSSNNSNFHQAAKMHKREIDAELLGYGSLARSVAAHVSALQKAGLRD